MKSKLTVKQVHHFMIVPQKQFVLVSTDTGQAPRFDKREVEPGEELVGEHQFDNLPNDLPAGDAPNTLGDYFHLFVKQI